jgi:hypothetical protein
MERAASSTWVQSYVVICRKYDYSNTESLSLKVSCCAPSRRIHISKCSENLFISSYAVISLAQGQVMKFLELNIPNILCPLLTQCSIEDLIPEQCYKDLTLDILRIFRTVVMSSGISLHDLLEDLEDSSSSWCHRD